MVEKKDLRKTTEKMLKLSATKLPSDVKESIKKARENEEKENAKKQLDNILKNIEIAEKKDKPICQDTGVPLFFLKIPREYEIEFDLQKIIKNSIIEATRKIPLRPNIVDPLTRENSGNNTGEKHPLIHFDYIDSDRLEMDLLLKGAGSENWSRLYMLNPSSSKKEVKKRILNVVKKAGGQVCPPTILGIGIGGTADTASLLAKKSLLNPLDQKKDGKIGELERELKKSANELHVGPMGLGGKTTVLGVNIEKAGCHTASLPVALNFNCWAERRSRAVEKNGKLEVKVPK